MSLKILKMDACILHGMLSVKADGTEFVAGQPVKITADGIDLATNPEDVIGLAKVDRRQMLAAGPQAAGSVVTTIDGGSAVMSGIALVELSLGTLAAGTTRSPFDTTPTTGGAWAVGQRVFLHTSGVWDNAAPASNDPPFGQVLEIPSDDKLIILVNTMNGLLYSAIAT